MTNKISTLLALTLVALLSIGRTSAQTAVAFMDINPDAHVMGMANTGTVMYADAFAMWNNTASTIFSDNKLDVAAAYSSWQPSTAKNSTIAVAGFGRIAKFMTVSAGFKYFTHQSYSITDDNGNVKGTFTPKEMIGGIGLGFKVLPILSLSANVNYLSSDIGGSKKGTGISADFGAMLHFKCLNVGVTAANIGSKIDYGGTSTYKMPVNVKVGVGTSIDLKEVHMFTANLQAGMFLTGNSLFGEVGLEYMYHGWVAIRAGYHYGDETKYIPSYASVGIGGRFLGITLDAAYLIASSSSPINGTFMITAGWKFGNKK